MTQPTDPRPHLVERLEQVRAQQARTHLVERAASALAATEAKRDPVASTPHREPPRPTAPPIPMATLVAAGLVAAPEGARRARVLEEIAVVQTQLLRALSEQAVQDGRAANLVMFTSARPGEGKSFCSLNVAAGLARASTRPVLLVDADGKQGSLTMALGQTDSAGLMALAMDSAVAPAGLVVPTEVARLSILPYGPATAREGQPPGPRLSGALHRLASALPQHIIIIDTPPCLVASDPSTIATVVGQVVVVVQAQRTERREVEAALDMVESCPTLYLLLNQAQLTESDSFGAYGGYDGYGDGGGNG